MLRRAQSSTVSEATCRGFYCRSPPAADVEMTGYMLLSMVRDDAFFARAPAVAKWLLSQRNALGGFSSTQDTVVALQALSAYATLLTSSTDLSVSVSGLGGDAPTWALDFTDANRDILQSRELPGEAVLGGGDITVAASGSGLALVQLAVRYNTFAGEGQAPEYEVSCDWHEAGHVQVTARCLRSGSGSPCEAMAIIKCGVFTGFSPVQSSLDSVKNDAANPVKRVEVSASERAVFFYATSVGSTTSTAFRFDVTQDFVVEDLQATTNQAYDYYQPNHRGESFTADLIVAPRGSDESRSASGSLRCPAGGTAVLALIVLLLAARLL